jgi:transcriptional regulator with XRE-family HTH domain
MDDTIARMIKEYRKKAKLTQEQLANKLGYECSQFVSMVEAAKAKPPHEMLGQLIFLIGLPEKEVIEYLAKKFNADLKTQLEAGKLKGKNGNQRQRQIDTRIKRIPTSMQSLRTIGQRQKGQTR